VEEELINVFQKKYPLDSRFLSLTVQLKILQANIREAKAYAEKAIQIDKDSTVPKFLMAFCLQCEGNHSGAINLYKKIIKSEPCDAIVHLFMAESLSTRGRFNDAIAAYQEAMRVDQDGDLGKIAEESIVKLKEEM